MQPQWFLAAFLNLMPFSSYDILSHTIMITFKHNTDSIHTSSHVNVMLDRQRVCEALTTGDVKGRNARSAFIYQEEESIWLTVICCMQINRSKARIPKLLPMSYPRQLLLGFSGSYRCFHGCFGDANNSLTRIQGFCIINGRSSHANLNKCLCVAFKISSQEKTNHS